MELSYEDHYQTSVPLLKCDEELIVTLEDHQVSYRASLLRLTLTSQKGCSCKTQGLVLKTSCLLQALVVKCCIVENAEWGLSV